MMRTRTIGLFALTLALLGGPPVPAQDGFFVDLHSPRDDPFDITSRFRDGDGPGASDRFAAGSRLGYSWDSGVRLEGDLSLRRDDDRRNASPGNLAAMSRDNSEAALTFTGFFQFDETNRLQSHIGGGIRARDGSLDSAFATVLAPDGSHEPYRLMFNAGLDYGVADQTSVSLGYRYLRVSEAGITSGSDKALDPTQNQHMLRFRLRVGF